MINGCLIRQWVCNSRKIIEWKVQTICTRWMIRHTGKVEPILATNVESIMVGFIQWPLILHISLGALHGVDVIATRGKLDAKNWPRTRWGRSKLRKGDDDWSLGEKGRGRWVSTKNRNQWRVRCRFQSIRRGQQFWIAMRSRSRWLCRPCRGHSQVREEQ